MAFIAATAQVDLGVREHRNRPLDELAPQAMSVLLTVLRRAGVADDEVEVELLAEGEGQARTRHAPLAARLAARRPAGLARAVALAPLVLIPPPPAWKPSEF
jgi:hypothetical protein